MSSRRLNQLASILFSAALASAAHAQFVSGSTGTDGVLNITSDTTLPLDADGVFNYTTINVDSGKTLTITRNALNTPAVLLASGNVTIAGTISVDGQAGRNIGDALAGSPGSEAVPGPGGFPGGIGGTSNPGVVMLGASGGGPGGGAASINATVSSNNRGRGGNGGSHFSEGTVDPQNGSPVAPTYGDQRLLTLSGGSGGAGSAVFVTSNTTLDGSGGGAGGGAILIASSGSITVDGVIGARGGTADGAAGFAGGGTDGAGGGAGGAIRLMANSVSGSGNLQAGGGNAGSPGGNGLIRIEAFSVAGALKNNSTPAPISAPPGIVSLNPANVPTVQVSKIAGHSVFQPPTGSTTTPDVTILSGQSNPVLVEFITTNIPNGAILHLRVTLSTGQILTVDSNAVSSNAATASVTIPPGTGVLYATATF